MSVYVSGELKVSGIGKAGYGEIFFSDVDDDDKWYKAKLQFITIDVVCFDSQEDACEGILGGKVNSGDCVVITHEGPKASPSTA